MRKSTGWYAIIVMAIFLLPNIYSVVKGKELYPFTPAPMFGHSVGPDTRFYSFEFVAVGPSGKHTVQPQHPANIELHSTRFFFSDLYGSAEKGSPFPEYDNDSPGQLEKRLTGYFPLYFNGVDTTFPGTTVIELTVHQYDYSFSKLQSHKVGYYDLHKKVFFHTWNPGT